MTYFPLYICVYLGSLLLKSSYFLFLKNVIGKATKGREKAVSYWEHMPHAAQYHAMQLFLPQMFIKPLVTHTKMQNAICSCVSVK